MMLPGLRVVRGPDWYHGDIDGGIGYLGTVVKILSNNTVNVQWDVGTETLCRAGQKGRHDLRVYDNAQTGVQPRPTLCDGKCLDTDDNHIYGMRWKCLVCYGRDNCTSCYMSLDDVCTKHPFVRYATSDSVVVRVPPRHQSHKIPLYGIFPGAKVTKRGSSQELKQTEQIGIVKEVVNKEQSHRSCVKVEWEDAASRKSPEADVPLYRIGADGMMDLKLVSAVSPGTIYIDHLPVLDISMPINTQFEAGDKVRVDLNLETFQALMKEYGGWVPELEQVLGEDGTVAEVRDIDRHIVSVRYDSLEMLIPAIYTNTLTKISTISAGDVVDVTGDEQNIKTLQPQHGGWQPNIKTIVGAIGTVIRLQGPTEAIVEVNNKTYLLNTACLTLRQTDNEVHDFSRSLGRDKPLKIPAAAKLKPIQGQLEELAAGEH